MANGYGSDAAGFHTVGQEELEEIARKEEERRRRKRREDDGKKPNGDESSWPEPEPLFEPHEEEKPYPLDALPKIVSEAVKEYQPYGQQPTSLIASSALGGVSLACQGLANVARDPRLVGPISLYLMLIAMSGERKTAADSHFNAVIRRWEKDRIESSSGDASKAHAAIQAWEAEKSGLIAKIKRAAGDEAADIEALKRDLAKLEQNKPSGIILPHLFYEDVNAQVLAVRIAEGWPSTSLWSDEGGLVIGAQGMNDENLMSFTALLNRLFEGGSFKRDRLTTQSADIQGRRFTSSLMMQPIVFARLLGACGGAARNIGFIARNLTSWPTSTIGQRLYRDPPFEMPAIGRFNSRLKQLLDLKLPMQGPTHALEPEVLTLSYEAKTIWISFFNDIEKETSRIGELGDIQDIGSRIAEVAARLAANFHVLEIGSTGDLKKAFMEGAVQVSAWHLNEVRRAIGANKKPQDVADAELLLQWLLVKKEGKPVEPRAILQFGPASLRDKTRRDAAIKILMEKHRIYESGNPTRLILNPKARAGS